MPNTTGTDTRLAELKDWLSAYADQYELDLSTIRSASSDAGFRRYFRIDAAGGTRSYILMDAPPGKEDIRPFIRVDALCVRAGLNPPKILAADEKLGFMLLSDLGRYTYLDKFIEDRSLAPKYFDAATTALVSLQSISEPGILPDYSEEKIRSELSLFPEWYVKHHRGTALDAKRKRSGTRSATCSPRACLLSRRSSCTATSCRET